MRALAEFIMRGRVPAVVVALLGSWVPIITPAAVGLVTLRKGASEGALIALWAIMPSLLTLWVSDIHAKMAYASISVVAMAYLSAWVLRWGRSWSWSLMALVVLGGISSLLLGWQVSDLPQELVEALNAVFARKPPSDGLAGDTTLGGAAFATGLMAMMAIMNSLFGLLLARWWQALLYNPGGFQQEFHRLSLSPVQSLGLALLGILCAAQGVAYAFWAAVFYLPLLLVGIALCHAVLKHHKAGVAMLVVLYLTLFILAPVQLALVVAGFSDAWLNYRKRFNLKQ